MDVLSDVLEVLRFQGCVYFSTRFAGAWGVAVPAYQKAARFHVALNGRCLVRLDANAEPVSLNAGEMVIVPHGAAHILSSSRQAEIIALEQALQHSDDASLLQMGTATDKQQTTRLICGHLAYDPCLDHALFNELPSLLTVRGRRADEFAWFHQAVALTERDARGARAGNQLLTRKLSEMLFVQALRCRQEEQQQAFGFLAALGDPHIGRSLQAVHREVAKRWRVEDLAREAGLSRSGFADKFRVMLGVTPMQYLADWRIQKAKRMLVDSDDSIDRIAEQVGYESPAAFCRVFKKGVGQGPGGFRRHHRRAV